MVYEAGELNGYWRATVAIIEKRKLPLQYVTYLLRKEKDPSNRL